LIDVNDEISSSFLFDDEQGNNTVIEYCFILPKLLLKSNVLAHASKIGGIHMALGVSCIPHLL
jgi:hypothetical protein